MRVMLSDLHPSSSFYKRVKSALGDVTRMPKKPRRHEEDDLQIAVMRMVVAEARRDVLVFHPANGGARSKAQAARFKAMGVVAGIPDLVVIIDGRVHGVELKAKKGRASDAQKAMEPRWKAAGGVYAIARSVDEVRALLASWGALR